jgi:hypothetical protein
LCRVLKAVQCQMVIVHYKRIDRAALLFVVHMTEETLVISTNPRESDVLPVPRDSSSFRSQIHLSHEDSDPLDMIVQPPSPLWAGALMEIVISEMVCI